MSCTLNKKYSSLAKHDFWAMDAFLNWTFETFSYLQNNTIKIMKKYKLEYFIFSLDFLNYNVDNKFRASFYGHMILISLYKQTLFVYVPSIAISRFNSYL